jgi:hypothetical protein
MGCGTFADSVSYPTQPVYGRRCAARSMIAIRNGRSMSKRRYSRSEKAFFILSLIIVVSMVLGLIAVAITPAGF